MKEYLSVRGLNLEEARNIFKKTNMNLFLLENRPPGDSVGRGNKRVVDLRKTKLGAYLIWSYENYK